MCFVEIKSKGEFLMIAFFVALIVIMNPIGNLAIYVGLIDVKDKVLCQKTARNCAIAIFIILVISLWIGWPILNFFGISIGAFKVAGGLIVLGIAFSMLKGSTHTHKHGEESSENEEKDSIAVVPMAIPVIAGPGAITVLIGKAHDFGFLQLIFASIVCAIVAVLFWFALKYAPKIAHFLGDEGMKITSRVMGLILAAIAIQMVAGGLIHLFPVLSSH